jgi:phage baseplate assembly protein W
VLVRYEDFIEQDRYTDISSKKDGSLDCYNAEAINTSILNILLTRKGTIPFNYNFGAGLIDMIFEATDTTTVSSIMNSVLDEIEMYETRATFARDNIEVNINSNAQSVDLYIPYVISDTGQPAEFYKRLTQQ